MMVQGVEGQGFGGVGACFIASAGFRCWSEGVGKRGALGRCDLSFY